MSKIDPFKYYKSSPEIIKLATMYNIRYPLSLSQVEDILHERGIDITHETIQYWWTKLGPIVAKELKNKRPHSPSNWHWHIDEVFVKVSGKLHYLSRAVDHEETVLDCYITKRRNKKPAKKVLRKLVRQHGKPKEIVTDKLKSYRAGMRDLNMVDIHEKQQYKHNQIENSHLHFRRRGKMMNKFRLARSLQKFAAIQSTFQNHLNHQRHIEKRPHFKNLRNVSVNVWNEILVA